MTYSHSDGYPSAAEGTRQGFWRSAMKQLGLYLLALVFSIGQTAFAAPTDRDALLNDFSESTGVSQIILQSQQQLFGAVIGQLVLDDAGGPDCHRCLQLCPQGCGQIGHVGK